MILAIINPLRRFSAFFLFVWVVANACNAAADDIPPGPSNTRLPSAEELQQQQQPVEQRQIPLRGSALDQLVSRRGSLPYDLQSRTVIRFRPKTYDGVRRKSSKLNAQTNLLSSEALHTESEKGQESDHQELDGDYYTAPSAHNNNNNNVEQMFSDSTRVIPLQQQPQTLNEIYHYHSDGLVVKDSNNRLAGKVNIRSNQQSSSSSSSLDLLLMLKFARDFKQWDPRGNESQWTWAGADTGQPADNALFVEYGGTEHGGEDQKRSRHQQHHNSESDNNNNNDNDGYVNMFTLPFNRHVPPNSANSGVAVASQAEGYVQSKTVWNVSSTQRILARMKFSCKVINTEKHPFPAAYVANARDDPRLASCRYTVMDAGTSKLAFHFAATNEGVWAIVTRAPTADGGGLAFVAKRRVGVRPRYDTIVDAGIEFDARQALVNFYLNGYKVWTLYAIGTTPPDDGITAIDRGRGVPSIVNITAIRVAFGTTKSLDERDPNNATTTTATADGQQRQQVRLVNVQGSNSTFYSADDTFYVDDDANRTNALWGQGAIVQLIKLLIVRAESVPPTALTTVPATLVGAAYGGGVPRVPQYL